MKLRLLDGSLAGTITHASTISVKFPCGTLLQIWFLLTKLDCDFPAVLGLDWLTLHNPLIDWVRLLLMTPPSSLFFRYSYFTLNPYQTSTSTSMLSPLSPTSLDLLYDSFYESFLFLAYDLFGLIA